jgi:hypothetical protein
MERMEGRAPPGRRSFSEGGSRPLQESATTERGPPLSGLFKTVAAMIAPCSVKTQAGFLCPP